jgi:hypothetical protein
MQKYQNNVQTLDGRAIVGAAVTVTQYPGGAPATVYNANGSGVITQPILTNGDGEFAFYAANGRYQLNITGGGISVAQTITDIVLFDPDDAGGVITGSDLADTTDPAKGDALVGVKQPFTGAVARTQHDKNAESITVKDFGATGAGLIADNASIATMISAVGFVRFPPGAYLCTTDTFDAPLYFDAGAYLTVPAANTLTLVGTVDAPRQFIFQGDGTYLLRNDADTGENIHQIHAAWFGAFPDNNAEVDQAPRIAKLLSSLDNTREAIVQFDMGRYSIGSELSVPRATAIVGMGTRRTVFSALGNGYDLFNANLANGCKFKDFQFELSDSFPGTYRTSGAWIRAGQQLCEIENVWFGNANSNLIITAGQCKATNISATFDVDLDAGSSLVSIQASDAAIDGVMVASSNFGPDYLIEVGGASASNITNFYVNNVSWTNPSIGVSVSANSRTINTGIISGLHYRGTAACAYAAEFVTTGTGVLSDIVVDDVVTNSLPTNGFSLRQGSSVSMSRISFSGIKSTGTSGRGFEFIQTAGTLTEIIVDATVNVKSYATPYFYSGSMTNVAVSPLADVNANQARVHDFTIADDAVASIDLHRASSIFTGMLMVSVGSTEYGIFVTRPANSPAVTNISVSANMNSGTSVLTGTTGVDGKFTLGVTNGVLYFENRLGSSQRVSVSILYGIK